VFWTTCTHSEQPVHILNNLYTFWFWTTCTHSDSEQPVHILNNLYTFWFWTTCTHSRCRSFLFFSVGGTWIILCFLSSPSRRSAGSFTCGRLGVCCVCGVGGVMSRLVIRPSYRSRLLLMLALSFPERSQVWVLESISFALLILVCGVLFEQYETVLGSHVQQKRKHIS